MGRAPTTIGASSMPDVVRDQGMGDNLAAEDRVACAQWMEASASTVVVRRPASAMIKGRPARQLNRVVQAVSIPVGGRRLSIQQSSARGERPLVVLGTPS
jgi:hypothetical protein